MSIFCKVVVSRIIATAMILLAVVGLTVTASSQARTNGEAEARAAIEKVLTGHTDNWNRHDMDAWADAVLHEDSDWVNWRGGYWRGKAAIKAGHWAVHRSHYRNSRMTPQRIEDLVFLSPDMVLVHARSEMSGDERSPGQTLPYRKTILFTRQRGVWRIRALHNTRLLDPEPAAAAKQAAGTTSLTETPHHKELEHQVLTAGRLYANLVKRLSSGRSYAALEADGELAELNQLLADDYTYTSPSGEITNKSFELNWYKNAQVVLESVDVSEQKVRLIDKFTAVETGKIRFVGRDGGKPLDFTKRYTTTWVFRDGRWRITADHASAVRQKN